MKGSRASMCGVFGYIGEEDALEVCLKGLEHLEYRGYDSTGIAGIHQGTLSAFKKMGKLKLFKESLTLPPLEVAIAHTRWATHGKVSNENAHPHFNASKTLALIHNGIIENYDTLKKGLLKKGVSFTSETDTEVIAHLIEEHYQGDLVQAFYEVLPLLKGVFSLVCIHKNHPDQIIAAARNCPLSIAQNKQKTKSIISSDPNTFIGDALSVLFLKNNEIAKVKKNSVEIYGKKLKLSLKKPELLETGFTAMSKEGFAHYMLKEIYDQPASIQKGILGRYDQGICFEELKLNKNFFASLKKGWVLGCGTSYFAAKIACFYLEDLSRLPTSSEIASEARFKPLLLSKEDLVIALSQSGETADTLSIVHEIQKHKIKVLGICNVKNSTLARDANSTLFLKAGPEISVCSTKAFTSQLTVSFLLSLFIAEAKKILPLKRVQELFELLKKIPSQVQQVLDRKEAIQKLAQKYSRFNNFFFMGRRYMYPTALEAALKLKEISYVNANGYPAGELKHGAIALLSPEFPVIAFLSNKKTEEKMISNLMEVKARGAPLLVFAPDTLKNIEALGDDVFYLPSTIDELSPFCSVVASQLFAYFFALERGCDIDQPRNLAKSVTVE